MYLVLLLMSLQLKALFYLLSTSVLMLTSKDLRRQWHQKISLCPKQILLEIQVTSEQRDLGKFKIQKCRADIFQAKPRPIGIHSQIMSLNLDFKNKNTAALSPPDFLSKRTDLVHTQCLLAGTSEKQLACYCLS